MRGSAPPRQQAGFGGKKRTGADAGDPLGPAGKTADQIDQGCVLGCRRRIATAGYDQRADPFGVPPRGDAVEGESRAVAFDDPARQREKLHVVAAGAGRGQSLRRSGDVVGRHAGEDDEGNVVRRTLGVGGRK